MADILQCPFCRVPAPRSFHEISPAGAATILSDTATEDVCREIKFTRGKEIRRNKIWKKSCLKWYRLRWKKLDLKTICCIDWDSLIIVYLDWSGNT